MFSSCHNPLAGCENPYYYHLLFVLFYLAQFFNRIGAFERTAQEIQTYYYPDFKPDKDTFVVTFATRKSYNVQTRRIENIDDLAQKCKEWGATQKTLPKGKTKVVCEKYSFEDHSQADVLKKMMETDALIGEFICGSLFLY